MENKKTFGAFVLQRRKELGMTQKEFADRLFVTESAVSKWERGMSYPDITLLQNICAVLQVSEAELLNGAEDTSRRNSEKLAEKYLRLTRRWRVMQYAVYGIVFLTFFILSLTVYHRIGVCFIVLAAELLAASLTLAPALADMSPKTEKYKLPIAAGGFAASLELLLLVCCLYTGGSWFIVAGVSVLFGLSLVLLPFLLPWMPMPEWAAGRKTSVYILLETVLLVLLLLVCCVYTGGRWFAVAAVSVVFGLSLFLSPVPIRQLPLPKELAERKTSLYLLLETFLLLALLFTCWTYTGGGWLGITVVSVLFGLGFFLLPVFLHQGLKGTPLHRHRALLYLGVQSVMLFALLLAVELYTRAGALGMSLSIAALALLLPWGILGAVRYLPVNGWFRASVSAGWTGLWIWLYPAALDGILSTRYGWYSDDEWSRYPLKLPVDFSTWDGGQGYWNGLCIALIVLGALAVIFAAVGLYKRRRESGKPTADT